MQMARPWAEKMRVGVSLIPYVVLGKCLPLSESAPPPPNEGSG